MGVITLWGTKRIKFRPFTKLIIFILAAVAALAIYASAAGGRSGDTEEVSSTGNPITCISSGSDIYTVVTVITGSESKKSLSLFMEVCNGFGIEAVFFMDTGYMTDNKETVEKIYTEGHTVGLLCASTSELTRSGFMKYLANRNDEFYSVTGRYPKYCYISGTPCRYASEVINAYGQYYIAYSVCIAADREQSIQSGYIAAVDLSDEDGVYAFARAVSEATSAKLEAVGMKEFIEKYESIRES